jgi:23S rRNA (cytidine1920-2'-O)/16S rRNA (cytidine1409-2'-O)-methyltransferase
MGKPQRLDAEMVRRGLATSRTEARRAIEAGKVIVRGVPVTRPATLVRPDAPVALSAPPARFVSRGGEKLDGALDDFGIEVAGRRWLDVGASTGGFTDRLLQGGAEAVVSLDVGYGQLDWSLRNDPRVTVLERVNARDLRPEDLPWVPDGVVADVSFISLSAVLPAVVGVVAPESEFVLLVKPQFEVGKENVGRKGVVRDPEQWRAAIERVAESGFACGLGLVDAVASRLVGPAGNREFFVHMRAGGKTTTEAIGRAVSSVST